MNETGDQIESKGDPKVKVISCQTSLHHQPSTKEQPMTTSAIPFCPECRALLNLPDYDPIKCDVCKFELTYHDLGQGEIVTTSIVKSAPRWYQELMAQKGGTTGDEATGDRHAKVDEPCPKCGHPEMSFYTMQLRSADEGSTVFYECLNNACGHKFSLNN